MDLLLHVSGGLSMRAPRDQRRAVRSSKAYTDLHEVVDVRLDALHCGELRSTLFQQRFFLFDELFTPEI